VELSVTPSPDSVGVARRRVLEAGGCRLSDEAAGLAPRATAPDYEGGFGLVLIEHLTRRWGVTREGGRTRVWFEFDIDAQEAV
jgi:hypothetical protein